MKSNRTFIKYVISPKLVKIFLLSCKSQPKLYYSYFILLSHIDYYCITMCQKSKEIVKKPVIYRQVVQNTQNEACRAGLLYLFLEILVMSGFTALQEFTLPFTCIQI